jgi:hypothetical protein
MSVPTIRIHILNEDQNERDDWQKQLDELMPQWEEMTAAQREQLYEQIESAIKAGNIEQLSELQADNDDGSALLLSFMVVMASLAGDRMVQAARDQGKDIHKVNPFRREMKKLSSTITRQMADQLALAAGREAVRVSGPYSTTDQVVSAVREHLEGLSDAFPREQLGGALWSAENIGRYVTLNANEPATYYEASEVRDKSRCEPCRKIDGKHFETLQEAVEAYPNGGYHNCLGGIRCRGTFDPVWVSEE